MKTKLVLLFAVLTAMAHAESSPASILAATAERAIERAALRTDAAALAEAVKPLDGALAQTPNDPALLYTRAYGYYASSMLYRRPSNPAALQKCFESAVALLERVKGDPWEAEAAGLRGSILGQLIGLKGGLAGMTLGPESGRLMAHAAKAAPDSPRVIMFRGVSLFNTPAMWGGDPAEGTRLLQQAVDRFAASDLPANGPHWGQADALTWLGLAKQKAGDFAAARAAWERALALEPDYGWVKFALLPSLGRGGQQTQNSATDAQVVADFFPAEGSAKKIGVLLLGGSEGGKPDRHLAQMFAQNGYAVLAPAYFRAEGLPDELELIPLEYLDRALLSLRRQANLRSESVVIVGASKGAELALLLAARDATVAGVIALSPSSVVWQGLPGKSGPTHPQSSWSLNGQPVPFVPYAQGESFDPADPRSIYKIYERSLAQKAAVAQATIAVEKIHGPVLLLSGSQDDLWPSGQMGDAILARLKTMGFPYPCEHAKYEDAGHTLNEYFLRGGTVEGNRTARQEASKKMLEFLAGIDQRLASTGAR